MPKADGDNPEFEEAVKTGKLPTLVENVNFDEFDNLGTVVSVLHNEGSHDFLETVREIDWQEQNPGMGIRWIRLFASALPTIKEGPLKVVGLCHQLLADVGQGRGYEVCAAFEKWASNNPSDIDETYSAVVSAEPDSLLVYPTLNAWRLTNDTAALAAALVVTHESRSELRRQAIQALGYYDLPTLKKNEDAIRRLLELATSEQEDNRFHAIGSIISILENCASKPDELEEALEAAADNSSPRVLTLLVSRMSAKKSAYSPALKARLFELMSEALPDDHELIDNIDHVFMSMDVEKDREIIFKIVTKILSRSANRAEFKVFDSLLYKLSSSSHQTLLWYCVRWLLTGERNICEGVADCFPPLSDAVYDFDLEPLGLSDEEIRYLCRKVFAYLMFCHGAAVSILTAAIIALKPTQRRALETEVAGFWLRNYPEDLTLIDKAAKTKKSRILTTSLGRMRKAHSAYDAPLDGLPRNLALRPSTSQFQVQMELGRERNKTIAKSAKQGSIFAGLFTESTLLYGRSSVTYMYVDKDSDPVRQEIPLQSFETSSALPRMDVLYPARLQYLLYKFRSEKRPS